MTSCTDACWVFSDEYFILQYDCTIFLSWLFFHVWYDLGREIFYTFMEVFLFLLCSIILESHTAVNITFYFCDNLNKIILFLAAITRDPPYWKHMELVNMSYGGAGRTCMQIYKKKKPC